MNAYGFFFVKPRQRYSVRSETRTAAWQRNGEGPPRRAAQDFKDAAKEQWARKDLRIQFSKTIARANGRFEARRPTRRHLMAKINL
jgi:hypothetical protein